MRRRHLPLAGAAIVIVMGWWLVLPWTTAFRPQVFTYLGCAMVLSLVARAEDGDYAALWWAVPLLATISQPGAQIHSPHQPDLGANVGVL